MISLPRVSLRLIRLWRMREKACPEHVERARVRAKSLRTTLTSNLSLQKEGEEVLGATARSRIARNIFGIGF
jgi:hypothetical protein